MFWSEAEAQTKHQPPGQTNCRRSDAVTLKLRKVRPMMPTSGVLAREGQAPGNATRSQPYNTFPPLFSLSPSSSLGDTIHLIFEARILIRILRGLAATYVNK